MLQTSVSAYVCVFNASYCASMLTPANRASLGEPLQTLSELVTGQVFTVTNVVGNRKLICLVNGKCDASLMTGLQVCYIGSCKCSVEVL